MVGSIRKIMEQYGAPRMKEALNKADAEAKAFAAERASQTAAVNRAGVTYTGKAVIEEAKKELHEVFTGMLGRELNLKEEDSVAKLAKGIAEEILS